MKIKIKVRHLRAVFFSGRWWSWHSTTSISFSLLTPFFSLVKLGTTWSHIHSPKFVRYVARSSPLYFLPSICTVSEKFIWSFFIIISPRYFCRLLLILSISFLFCFNFYITFIISTCQYYKSPNFFVWLIYYTSQFCLESWMYLVNQKTVYGLLKCLTSRHNIKNIFPLIISQLNSRNI